MITIFVFAIMIIMIYFIFEQTKSMKEEFSNYVKCNKLGVSKEYHAAFKKVDLNRINSDEWDMYHPCGYNYVETELKKIKPTNSKQTIFGISGCDFIVSKNGLWEIVSNYYGRERATEFVPITYILYDAQEMKLFNEEYKSSKMYLLKKNIQQKKRNSNNQ